jgi:anti-sigma regulatory factor (Ser/Thr protein kinase)
VHVPASARYPAGFPGRGGPGKAGAVMARVAVRESVTLAGRAERARAARAFVSEVLGPGHPCGDVAILLVSEIFSNSVRHSGSGAPGETVTVAVRAGEGVVRVEVTDRAGPGTPELRPAGRDAEGGRGLQFVAGLATRWGWRRRGGRMVTWFELWA